MCEQVQEFESFFGGGRGIEHTVDFNRYVCCHGMFTDKDRKCENYI